MVVSSEGNAKRFTKKFAIPREKVLTLPGAVPSIR